MFYSFLCFVENIKWTTINVLYQVMWASRRLRCLFHLMSVHLVKLLKSTLFLAKYFLLGTKQKRWVNIQALDGTFRSYQKAFGSEQDSTLTRKLILGVDLGLCLLHSFLQWSQHPCELKITDTVLPALEARSTVSKGHL